MTTFVDNSIYYRQKILNTECPFLNNETFDNTHKGDVRFSYHCHYPNQTGKSTTNFPM